MCQEKLGSVLDLVDREHYGTGAADCMVEIETSQRCNEIIVRDFLMVNYIEGIHRGESFGSKQQNQICGIFQ
tara:strand:+ start:3303 stop:3518 length:216 start_codon:yes stop_codon:yes gene_type:complete